MARMSYEAVRYSRTLDEFVDIGEREDDVPNSAGSGSDE